jgi:hypothetical protein
MLIYTGLARTHMCALFIYIQTGSVILSTFAYLLWTGLSQLLYISTAVAIGVCVCDDYYNRYKRGLSVYVQEGK